MNNEILTKAKNTLAARKIAAERDAKNNLDKAMKSEEFRALYQEYVADMIAEGKDNNLPKNSQKSKKKCEIWLKNHNLSQIEPNYTCKKCEDSGYQDGKMCDCLKQEVTKILISQSGFTSLEKFEQSNFEIFENAQFMRSLYQKMQQWCDSSSPSKKLIFLSGGTGTGKTHLIKCMANELIERAKVTNLTTAFALNQDLGKAYTSYDSDLRAQTMQKYLDCEYLFIDDLGTEIKQRAITDNLLYLVLNERRMRGLCTVITTNLDLNEVREQYDERIFSRIVDKDNSICIRLEGKDLRLRTSK